VPSAPGALVEYRLMEIRFNDNADTPAARKKRLRAVFAGGLVSRAVFLSLLLSITVTHAAQTPPVEHLHQVRARINELEKSLAAEAIKFKSARKEILEIERRLYLARQENENFRQQLEAKTNHILALREQSARLNQSYAATVDAVKKTLIARFMLVRQPKLKVLLNNTDITGLQRNLRYYDYVAAANNELLQKQKIQRGQLHGVESALKLEASKLRQIRARTEEHLQTLNQSLARRNDIAKSLEKLLKENEQTLDQLQEDESQLAKLVYEVVENLPPTRPATAPFGVLKGTLAWPTAGRIAKPPGSAMREGGAKWSGVIIESEPGSEVVAVADGQVAFADWFRNLGLLVIIDHGDGYMSLYGHNQKLHKESGELVSAGEIVATVGDTGGRSSTGLYFEIRQNGLPQDPRRWCKK